MSFTKMQVSGIAINDDFLYPFAVLENEDEEKTFPIILKNEDRPLDLPNSENIHASILEKLLEATEIEVETIEIKEDENEKLTAQITFFQQGNSFTISVKPFEAAIFGMQFKKSVLIENSLFSKSKYFKTKITPDEFTDHFLQNFLKNKITK